MCSSFLDRIWEKNGTIYDQCGVMKPNDCPDDMQDFDPYTCGDDLQIPSNAFKEGPGKASPAVQFINFYKPPGMDDYDFIDGGDTDSLGADGQLRRLARRLARREPAPRRRRARAHPAVTSVPTSV